MGIERDETWQAFVFGSQSVECPCSKRRANELCISSVHLGHRAWVDGLVAMHGANQAHLIGVLAQFWEKLRDPQAALAALRKLPRRWHQLRRVIPPFFPFIVRQLRLVIKRIDMRRSSLHAQEQNPFCRRVEMRLFRGERIAARVRVAWT